MLQNLNWSLCPVIGLKYEKNKQRRIILAAFVLGNLITKTSSGRGHISVQFVENQSQDNFKSYVQRVFVKFSLLFIFSILYIHSLIALNCTKPQDLVRTLVFSPMGGVDVECGLF